MKIKITPVNYLNTLSFKYGLDKYKDNLSWADIQYETPFHCAQMFVQNQTNIALAPVALLKDYPDSKYITDFCLSAHRSVDSVKLYSHTPIEKIQTVLLDYQSLSSVSLIKVLFKYHWKKRVAFLQGTPGFEQQVSEYAKVVIGDRTFALNGTFPYEYDLAKEWYDFFGKPFVFAVWFSNIKLTSNQLQDFSNALNYGVKHTDEAINTVLNEQKYFPNFSEQERKEKITEYLKHKICYQLDADRQSSIQHFIKLLRTI